jgi:S-DNA-T family DNA segregation ATPase FtsK/SpoIIIE
MARPKKQDAPVRSGLKNPFANVHLELAAETKRGIVVVIFLLVAVITALSLISSAGSFGQYLFSVLTSLFGFLAYGVPLLLAGVAIILFRAKPIDPEQPQHPYFRTYLGATLITGSLAGLLHALFLLDGVDALTIASQGNGGGYLGALFGGPTIAALGFLAGTLVLLAILLVGVLVTFNAAPIKLWRLLWPKKTVPVVPAAVVPATTEPVKVNVPAFTSTEVPTSAKKMPVEPPVPTGPKVVVGESQTPAGDVAMVESITLEDHASYELPTFDLLDDNKTEVDSGDIETQVAIIQKTLADFGVEVEMGEVNVGPTVTQYTLKPAMGVKLSQIATLQNDLALALSAQSVRMELPIPGQGLVGIEVPNKAKATVRLREVMQTTDFVNHKSKLVMALGRDVAGRPYVIDLAKMPHLLIAGASGMGKSVAINSLFVSLLYRNTPQDVRFIVVDPKRVELSLYNGIPHLLTPAITEPEKAVNALKWAITEMERRYRLFQEAGKRNIAEYNAVTQLPLPAIVIIVDELADLMAVAKADVESSIVRLAQMARAVGIHLILATQRPSVEVITGLIKANITARMAFKVPGQVDSRTILDASGAEKLLGNGDMLFISPEFSGQKRVQGAYIGEKEVKNVVDFFKDQAGSVIYTDEIVEKPKRSSGVPGLDGDDADDDLYEQAREEVQRAGKASASLLQRRLRVGYSRAARLIDLLEQKGVVGPADGAKPREVYGAIPDAEKAEYGIEPTPSDEEDTSF